MSKETFARETRMNLNEAEDFMTNFYKTFPTMTQYLSDIKQQVAETGYVHSVYGRPLYFDISRTATNPVNKARVIKKSFLKFRITNVCFQKMDRQAINFTIQASACDIMKVALEHINLALDRIFPFDFKSTYFFL